MPATVQPLPEVSPVSLDLNPPVCAESIDLRALIGHRTSTQASASVESVADIFKTGSVNFAAALDEQRLLVSGKASWICFLSFGKGRPPAGSGRNWYCTPDNRADLTRSRLW